MYHSHFGLSQSPFSITPNPDFFYSGSKRGDILNALLYAVEHGEGIIKVTGEVGSGKTMLCRMLAGMMPKNVEVIFLVNPTLSREEVMFTIAGELEINTEGKRPDEVIRLLHQDLIAKHISGKQVVLLVEEAQAMPFETLEEIRLFSNLETAQHKLLQIVLFGQPELDDNLSQSHMRQLKERITHNFKVPPMDPGLISDFLMFRMRTAGYHGPDLFTKDSIHLLADVSEGIIRRINILADKALLSAFAENTHAIEVRHIRAAIKDSEFTSNKKKLPLKLVYIAGFLFFVLVVETYFVVQHFWSKKENVQTENKVVVIDKNLPIHNPVVKPLVLGLPEEIKNNKGDELVVNAEQKEEVKKNDAFSENSPISSWSENSIAKQRAIKSKDWLNTSDKKNYTIQLSMINVVNNANLERFFEMVGDDLNQNQLYIYPSRLGNTPRFGIVFSNFATREEAQAKRLEIEKKWSLKAQLRTIGGLRSEIARTKSHDLW
jgi:MSHA biogenesis protein MshM